MKILITGSSGMVGKNILESTDFNNVIFLKPTRNELDLFNYENVLSYIKTNKPDFIIHAAGRVGGIQANLLNPVAFLIENLDINRNIILAARNCGVKKMINLGSSCMYPRDALNPLKEELILKGELEPTNEGYALAKITAQRLCEYINMEDASFEYKTLVPCNLYGRHDKFDPKNSHLIPAVITKLHLAKINNENTVEIWGDGTARREFMYTGDLANCIYQCVNQFSTLPKLMNVGLGHDYSVNEYYRAAADVVGYKGEFEYNLTKPVGMKQKLTSTEKSDLWGWKSKTSLHEGLEKTYEYFLKLKI